jgi:hypothetical protein
LVFFFFFVLERCRLKLLTEVADEKQIDSSHILASDSSLEESKMDGSTSKGLMAFCFFRLEPALFPDFWFLAAISFNIGLASQKELSA